MSSESDKTSRGEATGPAGSQPSSSRRAATVSTTESDVTVTPPQGTTSVRRVRVELGRPHLIYELDDRKRKKKKIKYTRGLKQVQKLERGLSTASQRASRAMEKGLKTYRKRRNKSARKKRDGALRDALQNWSIGLGRALRVGSDAPYDVTRELNTSRFTRRLRDTVLLFTPNLFR